MAALPTTLPILWNRYTCDALYLSNTPPTIAARTLATVHTAMYDALTLFLPGKETATTLALQQLKAQELPCDYTPENRREAYSYAAFRVLNTDAIFASALPATFKTELETFFKSLGYDPKNTAEKTNTPSGIGNMAARLVLEARAADHSNQQNKFADTSRYAPLNPPPPELPKAENLDHWQPQLKADYKPQAFLTPHWGGVKPFGLSRGDQFRPKPPINNCGQGFKEQADMIADISACLTDEQKMVAEYFAGMHEEQFPGLPTPAEYKRWITPPAQLSRVGCEIIEDRELKSTPAVIFLFALSNALLDASIAAWDAKRYYDYVRPDTLIRNVKDNETFNSWGGPGRGTVEIEGEGWQPYIPTPPFAEYVSGHSTFSSATAEIVKCFFGDGKYEHSITIPIGGSKVEGACVPAPPLCDITLSWTTVDELAEQAGMSRLYGGIHFKDGNLQGRELGKKVAVAVWTKACDYLNGRVGDNDC
jgi:hypothetical protein